MSDISNQLIKDSYNYVLQADIGSGIVYRIGGLIPVNPIFQSGLTVTGGFTYSGAGEQVGYALLTDGTGYAYWGPISAATPSSGVTSVTAGFGLSGNTTTGNITLINTNPDKTVVITGGTGIQIVSNYPNFGINFTGSTSGDYLPLSGGTVTGGTVFTNGLTANTISATTYFNLPVTGLTEGNGISITPNGNGNFTITSTATTSNVVQGITGITGTSGVSASTNDYGTIIINTNPDKTVVITGGTGIEIVSNYPNFGVNLTGTTGLTYYVSAATPSGVSLISGDRWFNTSTGIELVWINDGDSTQWIQPFSVPGPVSPDVGYHTVTGITTSQTLTWDKTYWGISAQTNVNLTLPTTTGKDGYYIIIKDEGGYCGSYRIRLTPASGLIDGNNYVDMNINYMSLTCMVRGGNWYLI